VPNSYFQFKQFTVHQDHCAMKVCTDACLFGAWVAMKVRPSGHVLDIGTGTGLLPLMLAQAGSALFDCIEIEESAGRQAVENAQNSPWKDRMRVYHADVKHFLFNGAYDLIISNPPFFENDLRSGDAVKNRARHDDTLTLKELAEIASVHLSSDGLFAVLLPFHRRDYFIREAGLVNLFLTSALLVKQTPKHPFFRAMLLFSKKPGVAIEEELTVRNGDHYTPEFTFLLKDYYLHL
jgi:tRNA1Val (adenine37-N6)-methyltransferase